MRATDKATAPIGQDDVFTSIILIRSCAGDPVTWVPAPQEAHAYIDTLHVEVRRPVSGAQLSKLRSLCRKAKQMRPNRPNCSKWRRVLHIQNPSRGALEWLRGDLRQEGLITRVDIALDLVVDAEGSAGRLQRFFERHLVQRWRGKRIRTSFGNTRYWANNPMTARNLAVYSDRPSKVTGAACCHIEHRTCTGEACRRRGLGTFDELLDFDSRAFWARELCLKAIDQLKMERAIDRKAVGLLCTRPTPVIIRKLVAEPGKSRRQAIRDNIRGDVAENLNVPACDLHLVDAQHLKDVAGWLADRCLVMVPNEDILMMVERYDNNQDHGHQPISP